MRSVTIRSRLGEYSGKMNGDMAYFDRIDTKTGRNVRHFILPAYGVKLMYEPWGWEREWYADMVKVLNMGRDVIEVVDLCLDVIIEGNGPTYRAIDFDDLADNIESGEIHIGEACELLRKFQMFLDDHLHKSKNFPPMVIRPYIQNEGFSH